MLTLEMCQKLKDAGFRQDTELGYFRVPDGKRILWTASPGNAEVACPTADEIWAKLTKNDQIQFIARYTLEDLPASIETALAQYWLEVNG